MSRCQGVPPAFRSPQCVLRAEGQICGGGSNISRGAKSNGLKGGYLVFGAKTEMVGRDRKGAHGWSNMYYSWTSLSVVSPVRVRERSRDVSGAQQLSESVHDTVE